MGDAVWRATGGARAGMRAAPGSGLGAALGLVATQLVPGSHGD